MYFIKQTHSLEIEISISKEVLWFVQVLMHYFLLRPGHTSSIECNFIKFRTVKQLVSGKYLAEV